MLSGLVALWLSGLVASELSGLVASGMPPEGPSEAPEGLRKAPGRPPGGPRKAPGRPPGGPRKAKSANTHSVAKGKLKKCKNHVFLHVFGHPGTPPTAKYQQSWGHCLYVYACMDICSPIRVYSVGVLADAVSE